jgi:hypothetical protein
VLSPLLSLTCRPAVAPPGSTLTTQGSCSGHGSRSGQAPHSASYRTCLSCTPPSTTPAWQTYCGRCFATTHTQGCQLSARWSTRTSPMAAVWHCNEGRHTHTRCHRLPLLRSRPRRQAPRLMPLTTRPLRTGLHSQLALTRPRRCHRAPPPSRNADDEPLFILYNMTQCQESNGNHEIGLFTATQASRSIGVGSPMPSSCLSR